MRRKIIWCRAIRIWSLHTIYQLPTWSFWSKKSCPRSVKWTVAWGQWGNPGHVFRKAGSDVNPWRWYNIFWPTKTRTFWTIPLESDLSSYDTISSYLERISEKWFAPCSWLAFCKLPLRSLYLTGWLLVLEWPHGTSFKVIWAIFFGPWSDCWAWTRLWLFLWILSFWGLVRFTSKVWRLTIWCRDAILAIRLWYVSFIRIGAFFVACREARGLHRWFTKVCQRRFAVKSPPKFLKPYTPSMAVAWKS